MWTQFSFFVFYFIHRISFDLIFYMLGLVNRFPWKIFTYQMHSGLHWYPIGALNDMEMSMQIEKLFPLTAKAFHLHHFFSKRDLRKDHWNKKKEKPRNISLPLNVWMLYHTINVPSTCVLNKIERKSYLIQDTHLHIKQLKQSRQLQHLRSLRVM